MSVPLPGAVLQEIRRLEGQLPSHREFVQTLALVESHDELKSIIEGETFIQASSWVEAVESIDVRRLPAVFRWRT